MRSSLFLQYAPSPKQKGTYFKTLISCFISVISISVKFCTRNSPIATASYKSKTYKKNTPALVTSSRLQHYNSPSSANKTYAHVCSSIAILEPSRSQLASNNQLLIGNLTLEVLIQQERVQVDGVDGSRALLVRHCGYWFNRA